jgi:hypothetical protein
LKKKAKTPYLVKLTSPLHLGPARTRSSAATTRGVKIHRLRQINVSPKTLIRTEKASDLVVSKPWLMIKKCHVPWSSSYLKYWSPPLFVLNFSALFSTCFLKFCYDCKCMAGGCSLIGRFSGSSQELGLRSHHKNKNARQWNDLNNYLPAIIHFYL